MQQANKKFLNQAGLLQDRVQDMTQTALKVAGDADTGYESFIKAKYSGSSLPRDELLAAELVELTPEEESLLTEALDKERPVRELECLERERKLQAQLETVQGQLVVANRPQEESVNELLGEMRAELERVKAENVTLTQSLETLQDTHANATMSHEAMGRAVERRLRAPLVTGDFKHKVVVVIGTSLLSQQVIQLLAEAGTSHVVIVDEPVGEISMGEISMDEISMDASEPEMEAGIDMVTESDAQNGLFQPSDIGEPRSRVLSQRLSDPKQMVYQSAESEFQVTVAERVADANQLSKLFDEVQPCLVLYLGSDEWLNECNSACLSSKQPWICAAANTFSWYMHLLCPGDTACIQCVEEDYHPAVKEKFNQVEETSRFSNTQCVASLVFNTTIKCLLGGGPKYTSIALVDGTTLTRDMLSPNPLCASAKCQCLQDGLKIGTK